MKSKILLTAMMASAFMFVGCSTSDSDEAKDYEMKKALDKGDFDLVIRELGDCENNSTGTQTTAERESCYAKLRNDQILDLGSAYLGAAGFDLIGLGGDFSGIDSSLSDDAQSNEVTRIIFEKLDNVNMNRGIRAYKYILHDDDSVCTQAQYSTLTDLQKQACVSMNPLLLKDLVDNDTVAGNESNTSVSLEDMIAFKDVLKEAAPGIEIGDIVEIMNDNITSGTASEKDVNANGNLDNLEATTCSVSAVNNSNLSACSSDNVTITRISENTFSGYTGDANLSDVILVKNVIASNSSSYSNATKYRLIQAVTATVYTNLTQEEGKFCDSSATESTSCTAFDDTSCFPCPKITGGEVSTLNDTVTTILNNDNLLTSIASSSDSESSLTDAQKVAKLQTEMCGLTPGEDSNVTNWISDSSCTANAFNAIPTAAITTAADVSCDCVSGELEIGQDGLLEFMSN